MSSSKTTTRLGRQSWFSIRRSLEGFASGLPAPQQPLQRTLHQAQSAHRPSIWLLGRKSAPSRSFSSAGKLSTSNVRQRCTSGGLLLLGLGSPSPSTPTVVASCSAAADAVIGTSSPPNSNLALLAQQAWKRSIHMSMRVEGGTAAARRNYSTNPGPGEDKTGLSQPKPDAQKSSPELENKPPSADHESISNTMSKYLQSHLPKMPHRPTKEEFLAAATGFWDRLTVRFKWFSIRSMRPWNADEWGAFVSWFMLGHLVWILVGTTTFFSLIIFMVNTVFAQEELAKWVGDYLTQSAGVTVIFESAIVPKWKDGVITFRNVFVSRRPGQVKSSVKKGSSSSAAAIAAAKHSHEQIGEEEDEGNYTQYDLTINTVDVTLSFVKWWNGKGLLKDVEVKGVRGVVDRTSVQWTSDYVDPLSYRHEHEPGDFEIEHFKLEDLLVTIHQPGGFRPFPVSIYSCELPQLRKQWLCYDFLSANHMSGSIDGSLFTIHPRQVHGSASMDDQLPLGGDHMVEPVAFKKFSRLRIDGLKIDHLNRGVEGPFGWIYEGNVDIIADIMFPADADEGIGKVMSDFYDKMEEAVTSNRYLKILEASTRGAVQEKINTALWNDAEQEGHLSADTQASPHPMPEPPLPGSIAVPSPAIPGAEPSGLLPAEEIPRYLVMDLRLHLNDVRAAVPFFPASDSLGHTRTQSYINAALIRPIVAYINAKRTYIPISCRIVKRASDFDGSWSVYDCGLMDDSSVEVYAAFARDVEDQQSRVRRLKKVGFWTLSMVIHALLAGVAGDLM